MVPTTSVTLTTPSTAAILHTPTSTAAKDSGALLPPVMPLAMEICSPLRFRALPTRAPPFFSSMTRSSTITTPRFRAPSRTSSRAVTFSTAALSSLTLASALARPRSPSQALSSTMRLSRKAARLALVASRPVARLVSTSLAILH